LESPAALGTLPAVMTDLASTLSALVPPGAECVVAAAEPADFRLLPGEQEVTALMVPKRLAEFRLGRCCAREALARLGRPAQAVPVGPRRAPVWPPGMTGSIAHHEGIAAAVAAPLSRIASVGIDIEAAAPVEPELARLIALPGERPDSGLIPSGLALRLVFSAKEAVFKCLWPHLRRYIDFTDVRVTFDENTGRFTVAATEAPARQTLCRRIDGRYAITAGYILTAAAISPAPEVAHPERRA